MRHLIFCCVGVCLLWGSAAVANTLDSSGLTIKLLSVWADDGGVLVQTEPKHSIEGLSCTGDYWLRLSKDAAGYEALLSVLLSAQATQSKITVRAGESGSEFCNLERVIITN